jgi:hypothetical protein
MIKLTSQSSELDRALNELATLTSLALNESGERVGSSFKRVRLASPYRILSSESSMYHLLIERIFTVTSKFV